MKRSPSNFIVLMFIVGSVAGALAFVKLDLNPIFGGWVGFVLFGVVGFLIERSEGE